MCVFIGATRVAQNTPDILQGIDGVWASVRVACRGRKREPEFGVIEQIVAAAIVLLICLFYTVRFYDDNILGLIKIVSIPVRPEEADHLIDTLQGGIEVGACLVAVACRGRQWVVQDDFRWVKLKTQWDKFLKLYNALTNCFSNILSQTQQ